MSKPLKIGKLLMAKSASKFCAQRPRWWPADKPPWSSEILSQQPTHQAGGKQQQGLAGSHEHVAQGMQNHGRPDLLAADKSPGENPTGQCVMKQKPGPAIDDNVQDVKQRAG